MSNENYERIPAEKFAFVQEDKKLRDKALETKARGYFADAMIRFSKNKSSVIASYILLFLILYAFIAPILSPYKITDKERMYVNYPAFVPEVAELKLGFLDGARVMDSQNDTAMNFWKGIATR